jgi:hypothetical protein
MGLLCANAAVRGAFFSDPLDGDVEMIMMLFQDAPPPKL